jgi:hypothetical protein
MYPAGYSMAASGYELTCRLPLPALAEKEATMTTRPAACPTDRLTGDYSTLDIDLTVSLDDIRRDYNAPHPSLGSSRPAATAGACVNTLGPQAMAQAAVTLSQAWQDR